MKKQKAPRLVTVAIFSTVTLIFWVFFSLYNVLTSKPSANVDPKLLEPLDPNLNRDTLSKLQERVFFDEQDVDFNALPSIILESPSPEPTQFAEEEPESLTPLPAEEVTPQGG